jgi:DMSO/TMAO reductase YedYZ molybdopterin-dependent catalytic subunit
LDGTSHRSFFRGCGGRLFRKVLRTRLTYAADVEDDPRDGVDGTALGRRALLGLIGLGVLGVGYGARAQDGLATALAPLELRDPTGLLPLLPLGNTFRYYSVAGAVPRRTAATYRLAVSGRVAQPANYTLADLQAMPQTALVHRFQCVTGWHVPDVHWRGVALSHLLELAQPTGDAGGVTLRSFDGTYTESLTLAQARASDVLVALTMLGAPVTHDHGGPVRLYVASMYGYKSLKWLSGIELTDKPVTGYWEQRGYPTDATLPTADATG